MKRTNLTRRQFVKRGILFIPAFHIFVPKLKGQGYYYARPSAGGGTPVATDNFDRSDAGDLGSNWTTQTTDAPDIVSNECAGNHASAHQSAFWNANAFNADQYSKDTIKVVNNGRYCGICVRASGTGASCNNYNFLTDGETGSGNSLIGKFLSGSHSQLAAVASTFTTNDIIELRATGTGTVTLKVFKNGVEIASTTDASSPHNSGSAGVHLVGDTARVDTWEGGNL